MFMQSDDFFKNNFLQVYNLQCFLSRQFGSELWVIMYPLTCCHQVLLLFLLFIVHCFCLTEIVHLWDLCIDASLILDMTASKLLAMSHIDLTLAAITSWHLVFALWIVHQQLTRVLILLANYEPRWLVVNGAIVAGKCSNICIGAMFSVLFLCICLLWYILCPHVRLSVMLTYCIERAETSRRRVICDCSPYTVFFWDWMWNWYLCRSHQLKH